MSADWQPLERMLGPYSVRRLYVHGSAPNRFICTSTEIRDGISTLLQMGHAFATQLTAISRSDSRRRSSTFSIEDR